jgi:hypothetical protein
MRGITWPRPSGPGVPGILVEQVPPLAWQVREPSRELQDMTVTDDSG